MSATGCGTPCGEGYAAVLRERVAASAPPVRLGPPASDAAPGAIRVEGGCLVCGVAAVEVPAAQVARWGGRDAAAREVWRPVTLTHRADRISGHVYPPCASGREGGRLVGAGRGGAGLHQASGRHRPDPAGSQAAGPDHRRQPAAAAPYGVAVAAAVTSGLAVPAPSEQPWGHLPGWL
jgi:hypothetical protein